LSFYQVLELQRELVNTEDRIQAARRFYNGNVRDYKNRCQTSPSSIVAGVFGFEGKDFFDVEPAMRQAPSVAERI
jgi:LemA protein